MHLLATHWVTVLILCVTVWALSVLLPISFRQVWAFLLGMLLSSVATLILVIAVVAALVGK
jgi:hypothetical protein